MIKRSPNPIDIHVGNRIRMRRMLINMSQEKLGDSLGLTFQQVQKYEKGSNRVSASRLYQMAQILGVTVQFFYDDLPASSAQPGNPGMSEAGAPSFVMDFLSSSDGLQLNRAFSEISDRNVKRRVIELVKALAEGSSEKAAGSGHA